MTWLKLSDDFGDDCARARLSDAAFRTHVEGLIWTMRRETDGVIDDIDIRRFAESKDHQRAVQELLDAGWWQRISPEQLRIIHAMEHQPEADLIERRRKVAADRKRRERRRRAGLLSNPEDEMSRRDVQRDGRRDGLRPPGRVGAGRDGPGKNNHSPREEELTDLPRDQEKPLHQVWPEVRKPGSGLPRESA